MFLPQPKLDQVSTLEERSLLSFQRPVPHRPAAQKSLRLAPEASGKTIRIGYESGLEAPRVRVTGTFRRRPLGQPRKYSATD